MFFLDLKLHKCSGHIIGRFFVVVLSNVIMDFIVVCICHVLKVSLAAFFPINYFYSLAMGL